MAFWSSQTIKHKQTEWAGKNLPLIDPFNPKRRTQGAYELALSKKVLITPDGSTGNILSPDSIRIPPGQFALLYSDEWVNIPRSVIAFISLKGRIKFKGLINISGFQVDPGFSGQLKFSVYNASSEDVYLNYGEPCFLIWFADLDHETDDEYKGEHKDQKTFTTDDRERMSEPRHSSENLHKRLKEMEDRVGNITAVGLVVIIPLIIGLVVAIFDHWFGEKTERIGDGGIIIYTALVVGIAFLLLNLVFNGILGRFICWLKNRFRRK
jgi:dCTP deaminase